MKTTKKDFELFKTECQKWIDKLGLHEWDFYFKLADLKGSVATTACDCEGHIAKITLNTNIDRTACFHSLEDTAKHEILHVLMSPLMTKATYRYVRYDELDEAEHSILMRLIKLL